MKSLSPSESFAQKLLFYGIGTSALAVAATAHAAVVTTPVGQTGNTFYFTLQNTTVSTTAPVSGSYFEIYTSTAKALATTSSSTTAGAATNYLLATESKPGGSGGTTATNYVLKLGVGTTIGSQAFTASGNFNNYYAGGFTPADGSHNGDWAAGARGFVGLQITTGTGGIDYGFADVTVNNYSGTNAYTLNGIAYNNTPGAAITAFAIPEPGSTTALLVAGAVGSVALRARRRKA